MERNRDAGKHRRGGGIVAGRLRGPVMGGCMGVEPKTVPPPAPAICWLHTLRARSAVTRKTRRRAADLQGAVIADNLSDVGHDASAVPDEHRLTPPGASGRARSGPSVENWICVLPMHCAAP